MALRNLFHDDSVHILKLKINIRTENDCMTIINIFHGGKTYTQTEYIYQVEKTTNPLLM